ncbi:mechanosensitive ion channel family protein [Mucilaginibacter lacusdianchii]|uniref:mechanosensitive ion channel family protein n=1 Tax=Mucilaginibacter lacusdianchii TaxID=2684211 RepID=UPI00131C9674|nr:mechanosensitive ion channel [Mucilaginibacter sp. JXJ CY 39]
MDINHASKLILDKLTLWLRDLVRLLPNIALAALILVVGFFVAKKLSNALKNVLRRFIHNQTLDNLFGSLIYIFLLGIVIFIALSVLKLDKAVTSILAGAGIVGLALAFAFQDIAANFMSGIFLSVRRPLYVGDIVRIKDFMGKVEEINLRDTILRTFQGPMVIVPNKDVFQNPIENFSMLGKRRFDLNIGISYGEDLEKVKSITLDALTDMPGLCPDLETTMFYQEFADSSINFVIRLWVNSPEQPAYLQVGSDAIMRIKKAYDANDIMIPFPIRTLDFGIKGGVPLSEMKP